jgi:hypothetical protein
MGLPGVQERDRSRRWVATVERNLSPCAEPLVWTDAMTGLESRSLEAEEYREAAFGGWPLPE